MRRAVCLVFAAAVLSACASTPPERGPGPGPERPVAGPFALEPADFSDLPGWRDADLAPALLAFRRMCDGRSARASDQPWSSVGRYGGAMSGWQPACAAAQTVAPGGERAF